MPASVPPWMRAREVLLHLVDLGIGTTIEDLPSDFLMALVDDVAVIRSAAVQVAARVLLTDEGRTWEITGPGARLEAAGPLAAVAAWLIRRPGAPPTTIDGGPAPALPPWL